MTSAGTPRAGRRRASSREILEEAAGELFLEQSYAGTTIEQIATRAGVSRNTFFNYFAAKSDVLWASVDRAVDTLADALARREGDAGSAPLPALRAALCEAAGAYDSAQLPLAITQFETIGMPAELASSGLSRFLRLARLMQSSLVRGGLPGGPARARVVAYALAGAIASAGGSWAAAGVGRGRLDVYLAAAVDPILAGFADV